jgi:Lrp/AsnC family transcriptional regulator, leucine-responsive regulatory protein
MHANMMQIDETDAIIIKELFVDARKSFASIAKELGMSTANICTHFSELVKSRVIIGSTLQLDYKKLGYNAVCDILIKCSHEHDHKLIKYMETMPNIYGLYKGYDSRADIAAIAILRDLTELDQTKDIIKKSLYITDLTAEVWTDIKNIPEHLEMYPGIEHDIPQSIKIQGRESISLDNIDLRLIGELSKNAQATFSEISKEIQTSIDTAARRYKKLVENKIIKPCIQIDVSKLGYKANSRFYLSFSSCNDTKSVIKQLMEIKDSYLIIKTSGGFDVRVNVMLRDLEQFLTTRSELQEISGINRLESTISPVPNVLPSQSQYITTF